MVGAVKEGSERFGDFPAAEAPGADPNPLRRAVHDRSHALKIRIERTFRLIVGVTDVMA